MKMFNDSNSFYYCQRGDVTNTVQRRHRQIDGGTGDAQADDRFFWNKHMLAELINSDVYESVYLPWFIIIICVILPLIWTLSSLCVL